MPDILGELIRAILKIGDKKNRGGGLAFRVNRPYIFIIEAMSLANRRLENE